jgi:hypothetical protein
VRHPTNVGHDSLCTDKKARTDSTVLARSLPVYPVNLKKPLYLKVLCPNHLVQSGLQLFVFNLDSIPDFGVSLDQG